MDKSFSYKLKLNMFRILGRFFSALGFKGLTVLSNGIGSLVWLFYTKRRKPAINNIQYSFNCSEEEAKKIAKESFKQNIRSFADIFLTHKFGLAEEQNLIIDDPETWKAFYSSDRPAIAAVAHIGAWELLATVTGELFYNKKEHAILVRGYSDPSVEEFVRERRAIKGASIAARNHTKTSLRVLNKNGTVATLVDHRPLLCDAINLPFFNRETPVNKGPAILAVRTKAIVWPVFLVRSGTHYILKTPKPLDTALLEGTKEEKIKAVSMFYTQAVENIIKEYPEQWFWLHDRWKTPAVTHKDVKRAQNSVSEE